MKNFKTLVVLSALTLSLPAQAESLDEQVARNAARCLVGHIATGSSEYQSGETVKYLLLIEEAVGPDEVFDFVAGLIERLGESIRLFGGSTEEEGQWLKATYCPGVDEILATIRSEP